MSASYGGHKVAVSPIEAGKVGPAQQIVETAPNAHAILTDPANRYVLATSLGGDIVNQYRFDAATGKLSPNDPPAAKVKDKAGHRATSCSTPDGKLVYLLNELDGSVVRLRLRCREGAAQGEAERQRPAGRLRRQALGGGSARHA